VLCGLTGKPHRIPHWEIVLSYKLFFFFSSRLHDSQNPCNRPLSTDSLRGCSVPVTSAGALPRFPLAAGLLFCIQRETLLSIPKQQQTKLNSLQNDNLPMFRMLPKDLEACQLPTYFHNPQGMLCLNNSLHSSRFAMFVASAVHLEFYFSVDRSILPQKPDTQSL